MEYGSHCVRESWVCVGHVHFKLFVSISFALGAQGKHIFGWNMGFRPPDELRGRQPSDRTSIKDLRPPGELVGIAGGLR